MYLSLIRSLYILMYSIYMIDHIWCDISYVRGMCHLSDGITPMFSCRLPICTYLIAIHRVHLCTIAVETFHLWLCMYWHVFHSPWCCSCSYLCYYMLNLIILWYLPSMFFPIYIQHYIMSGCCCNRIILYYIVIQYYSILFCTYLIMRWCTVCMFVSFVLCWMMLS
jgi:hypothetical protein